MKVKVVNWCWKKWNEHILSLIQAGCCWSFWDILSSRKTCPSKNVMCHHGYQNRQKILQTINCKNLQQTKDKHVTNNKHTKLGWQMTRKQNAKMTRWQNDRMTRWQDDKMTRWQDCRMTHDNNMPKIAKSCQKLPKEADGLRTCWHDYMMTWWHDMTWHDEDLMTKIYFGKIGFRILWSENPLWSSHFSYIFMDANSAPVVFYAFSEWVHITRLEFE